MYYPYAVFLQDLKTLQQQVKGIYDALLKRGGMSHILALVWNIRAVYGINAISYDDKKAQHILILENTLSILENTPTILENIPSIKPKHKKILILDNIVDSGQSLDMIMQNLKEGFLGIECFLAVIFQKTIAKIKADFFVKNPKDWVEFWEINMLRGEKC